MNQKDENYMDNICRVFSILPENKQAYLTGIAEGMAAMIVAAWPPVQQPQAKAGA